jgi:hypothetical protein
MISGFVMDKIAMRMLFPYATVFAGCAFITMLFVKHGDAKPEAQGVLESLAGADD